MAHADFLPTGSNLMEFASGTFTPVVQGSGTAGTASYSQQEGDYRRFGDGVYCDFRMNWSSFNGTGGTQVGDLPLVSSTSRPKGFGPLLVDQVDFQATSFTMTNLQVQQNSDDAFFITCRDNDTLASAAITSSAAADGQIFYRVDL